MKTITLGSIAAYVLGVSIFVGTLQNLFQGEIFVAIIGIVLGTFIFPPASRLFEKKTGLHLSFGVKCVVVIALVAIWGRTTEIGKSANNSNREVASGAKDTAEPTTNEVATDTKKVQKAKSEHDDSMQTFRWAFNPALGCNKQTTTPAQMIKKMKSCKASVIPNPTAKLILVKCAIEANGTTAGSLDYVFTKSQEMCLQVQGMANRNGGE